MTLRVGAVAYEKPPVVSGGSRASWRSGARRSPAITCTTPAGGSRRQRFKLVLKRCVRVQTIRVDLAPGARSRTSASPHRDRTCLSCVLSTMAAETPLSSSGMRASFSPISTPESAAIRVRSLESPRCPIRNMRPFSLPSPAPSERSNRILDVLSVAREHGAIAAAGNQARRRTPRRDFRNEPRAHPGGARTTRPRADRRASIPARRVSGQAFGRTGARRLRSATPDRARGAAAPDRNAHAREAGSPSSTSGSGARCQAAGRQAGGDSPLGRVPLAGCRAGGLRHSRATCASSRC